jgi:hypothetical protein
VASGSFRVILLTLPLLGSACAGGSGATRAHHRPCTVRNEVIDDYQARAAARASNKSRDDVLEAHETVYVSFALGADGSASDFRLDRPSRAEAGQEILRAAAAAAPYPKPPFDPEACLWKGRLAFSIIGHIRCDSTRASAYTDAVGLRLRNAIHSAGLVGLEPEKVTLKVKIDARGNVQAITVHDAKTAELGERVATLARALSPLEAPGDSIRQCVADLPFFIWVDLPGTTRGPILIREH